MAVRASREVVFEAPPEAILDALADIDQVPAWSSLHKHAEVVDRHPDGRPRRVKATLKIMGITEQGGARVQLGSPTGWSGTPRRPSTSAASTVEYNLTREGDDKTRVRFDIILDLAAPIPEFLIKRAKKIVLDVATESLRKRVMEKYAS